MHLTWGRERESAGGRRPGSGWLQIGGTPRRRVGRQSGGATPWLAGDEEEKGRAGELAAEKRQRGRVGFRVLDLADFRIRSRWA